MTAFSVPVNAGSTATVSTGLTAGSIVQNLDSSKTIWISSDPSVSPGYGVRIGPLGYAQWNNGGQPCYAVVDEGTTGSVMVAVSSDSPQAASPVDTAAAVATRLLSSGVPNVMQGKFIFDGPQVTNTGQQNITNVSSYANLSIRLLCQDSPQFWTLEYWDSTLTHRYYQTTIPASFNGAEIILDSTVRGDVLVIKWTTTTSAPANLLITVYGSNRTVSEQVTNGTGSFGALLGPQTYTQFTTYPLAGTFVTDGGMHRLVLDTSGTNAATATGMIQLCTVDFQGNPLYIEIAQLSLNEQGKGGWGESYLGTNVILPRGAHTFRWQHLTSGASINYQVSVAIYPG